MAIIPVTLPAVGLPVIGATPSTMLVADANGNLATAALPVSDRNLVFTQSTPSASWTIAHGLNKFPAVAVADSAGSWVVGDVTYLNANSLRIDFNGGFSGQAFLN